ncbi:pimeloyl-ACP methyl ester carboxylesterase [Luteibacter sp. OK325]|uniref:alpha/beta fold hydrolase n=1 Tax=Luteibacter sp. OK325 TaxID=2135670 RepID=UPI000D371510|nr:alpha/beta hydrolase [Luteibacter sp. OK325]PTR34336.1 pimeloyl-ACP methyl ester carboxylesterase [Luteibacter sp. OK325]
MTRPKNVLVVATIAMVSLVVVLLVAGTLYNQLALHKLRSLAHAPGEIYRVDGYDVHMFCTGEGSPTVMLDTGLGDDFTTWVKVQPELSRVTRVCSFDRSGFGSSAMTPRPHDADTLAAQLHDLVRVAGIDTPFVLVGHSISGLYLRAYAKRYVGELAALVFIDAATPLQDDRVPRSLVAIQESQRAGMPWQKLLMTIGWYRLQGICSSVPAGFEAYSAVIQANNCDPTQFDALEAELDAVRQSGEETLKVGPFPHLPVLILSRDPTSMPSNWPPEVARANSLVWNQMQEESKDLSPISRRIIAKGSDHYIHVDRPDLVNREVTGLVEALRRGEVSYSRAEPTIEE